MCKWTYCPPDGWDSRFWISIGLEDLVENNFSKIGNGHFKHVQIFQGDRHCLSSSSLDVKLRIFFKPGSVACPPGSPLGDGLTEEAAADLGLLPGTAVGASLIDAHAGGLGMTSEIRLFPLPNIYLPTVCTYPGLCRFIHLESNKYMETVV